MDRGKVISLDGLLRSHSDDIEQMIAAIHGDPGSTLWTAEMRAATRGGKCRMGIPEGNDQLSD